MKTNLVRSLRNTNASLLARLTCIVFALAVLCLVSVPKVIHAESTNRNEVRANLERDGWFVVYGDLINEADYARFVAAVASSVACECPAPIYAYFNDQLQQQLTKIRKTAPSIAQNALEDLLVRAFNSKGRVLRMGRLEVSGDLATYKRWDTVIYDEPRSYKCKIYGPFDTWTWGVCWKTVRVEKKIPYPNNFQPYFRFRWTGGEPTSAESNFQIKFQNKCSKPIYLAVHYLDLNDQWTTQGWYELAAGQASTVAYSRNSIFQYYAEAKNGNYKWEGTDAYRTVRNDSTKYGFKTTKINMTKYGTWTQGLTCTKLNTLAPQAFALTATSSAGTQSFTTLPLPSNTQSAADIALPNGITLVPPEHTMITPDQEPECFVDVCVTNLVVSPDAPKRGQDVTFTATFMNDTGQERSYDFLILLFDPNKEGLQKGFGESPRSKIAVPPGVSTTTVTYRAVRGPGPCMLLYAQPASYQNATNKQSFPDSGGQPFRAYFEACP